MPKPKINNKITNALLKHEYKITNALLKHEYKITQMQDNNKCEKGTKHK